MLRIIVTWTVSADSVVVGHDQMLCAVMQRQSAQFAAAFAITLLKTAKAVWCDATDCYANGFDVICSTCITSVFTALGCCAATCHVLLPGLQISESDLTYNSFCTFQGGCLC